MSPVGGTAQKRSSASRSRLRAGARSILHRLRDACGGVRVRRRRPGDGVRRPARHARRDPDRLVGPDHPGPVHGDDVRSAAVEMLLDPSRWRRSRTALAQPEAGDGALVQAIADGAVDNETDLDPFVANRAVTAISPRRSTRPSPASTSVTASPITSGHKRCSSSSLPTAGPRRHRQLPRRLRTAGRRRHDPRHRWHPRSGDAVPVGGAHRRRPRQRPSVHVRVRRTRRDQRRQPVRGDPRAAYLADPTALPPEGAACSQDLDPFGP